MSAHVPPRAERRLSLLQRRPCRWSNSGRNFRSRRDNNCSAN